MRSPSPAHSCQDVDSLVDVSTQVLTAGDCELHELLFELRGPGPTDEHSHESPQYIPSSLSAETRTFQILLASICCDVHIYTPTSCTVCSYTMHGSPSTSPTDA